MLLVPGSDLRHHGPASVAAPHDLRDGKALADRVQQVVLHVLEALHAAQLFLDEGGGLLVPRLVAERDNLEVQARDGVLPGLELTEEVGVLLLHLLEQLHLPQHVSGVRFLEDLRQPDRRQAAAGISAVFVRHMGDGNLPVLRASYRGDPIGLAASSPAHTTASSTRRRAVS